MSLNLAFVRELAVDPFDPHATQSSLARQTYTAVRRAIHRGDLRPGRFYSESQLSKVLDVSRTPVREALIELAREGAIERIPQRGFRLRTPTLAEVEEGYTLRALIEPYVVQKFIEGASSEALAELAAIVKSQAVAADQGEADQVVADEFHFALPMAIGLQQCHRILLMLKPFLLSSVSGRGPSRAEESIREHVEIMGFIAARDADGAVSAMRRHVLRTAQVATASWTAVNSVSASPMVVPSPQ